MIKVHHILLCGGCGEGVLSKCLQHLLNRLENTQECGTHTPSMKYSPTQPGKGRMVIV